jgi:uncharacterized membrane protein YeaQ/YmgE (transglycosylase-associated protein family)
MRYVPFCTVTSSLPVRLRSGGNLRFPSTACRINVLVDTVRLTITGIISAILIGLVIGVLGRLVVPGKQHIPIWLMILVGIGAAFLGTALARAMGIPTATEGIDCLELLVPVVVAAIGVAVVASLFGRSDRDSCGVNRRNYDASQAVFSRARAAAVDQAVPGRD